MHLKKIFLFKKVNHTKRLISKQFPGSYKFIYAALACAIFS